MGGNPYACYKLHCVTNLHQSVLHILYKWLFHTKIPVSIREGNLKSGEGVGGRRKRDQ